MKLRLVKFLTSRENEIEKKEEGRLPSYALPPPSQATARAPLRSRSPPPFIFPSFPSSSFAQPATCRPSLSAATCRQAVAPAIPPPAVPLLSFFFIKLPKQQGMAYVAWCCTQPAGPTCRSSQPVQPQRRPARRTLASSPNQVPRLLSGSNGILSVEDGAIGKQRPKINYPVSFPSLLNK